MKNIPGIALLILFALGFYLVVNNDGLNQKAGRAGLQEGQLR